MKTLAPLFLLVGLSCQASYASEPIPNLDALEKELKQCLLKAGPAPTCLQKHLPKHLLPGNEQLIPVAGQIDDILTKWLNGQTVFAVHSIKQRKAADYFEKRSYIIEDTSGAPMTMNISVIRQLGKLYVYGFNVSSNEDKISRLLGEDE
jgi:hypothetical protein